MEYKTEFITIYKIGYQIYDVPDEVYETVYNETNEMIGSNFKNCIPYNKFLVGNLSKEFQLVKSIPILDQYISDVAPFYFSNYYNYAWKEKFKIKPRKDRGADAGADAWVNFQKKGEMNPIHRHSGSLSFVMYIKIPYNIEDEQKHSSSYNSDGPALGCFQFVYVDQYTPGGITTHTLPTDKTYEKKMILFSASLNHTVYPFLTSDEYRISVAGNIVIDEY